MDHFSVSLSEADFHRALALQREVRGQNLAQGAVKLLIHTSDMFGSGFTKFPQVAKNQFVEDQLNLLDAAQDNLNGNQDSDILLGLFT